jgi:aldehyde dehydrogenase (NAD+)
MNQQESEECKIDDAKEVTIKSTENTTTPTWYTPVESIPTLIKQLHNTFKTNKTKSYTWRVTQLQLLRTSLVKFRTEIETALDLDLKQNAVLKMNEVEICLFDIDYTLKNLKQWMKDTTPSNKFLMMVPSTARIMKEPYGVTCVISPWNYPIQLLIRPVIGAIAAGNCVVMKPSEVTPNCAQVIAKLIENMDRDAIAVVNGGVNETGELLDQKFDYLFYTGSPAVGKIIMQKAAVHLTPVTLELGGKSPLYIDETFNWDVGTSRIVWGKLANCGQTCVAPDYILLDKKVDKKKFCDMLIAKIQKFYSEPTTDKCIQSSNDYSRIVNERHTKRLAAIIEEQKQLGTEVVYGSKIDVSDRFVEPTIFFNPPLDSQVMTEEIFGPILPIVPVEDHKAAIEFINDRHYPLALYIFSTNDSKVQDIINSTRSGGVAVNDCVVHFMNPALKFGGIGQSGMGSYGSEKHTFDTFTHEKSIMSRPYSSMMDLDLELRYPPYSKGKVELFANTYTYMDSVRGLWTSTVTLISYYLGLYNRKQ